MLCSNHIASFFHSYGKPKQRFTKNDETRVQGSGRLLLLAVLHENMLTIQCHSNKRWRPEKREEQVSISSTYFDAEHHSGENRKLLNKNREESQVTAILWT
eukprot:scaffold253393_cov63-Attheya_sp.AAC.1